MKKLRMLCSLALLGCLPSPPANAQPSPALEEVVDGYVEAWKRFYPSRALAAGLSDAAPWFEDRSARAVGEWTAHNRAAGEELEGLSGLSTGAAIDGGC